MALAAVYYAGSAVQMSGEDFLGAWQRLTPLELLAGFALFLVHGVTNAVAFGNLLKAFGGSGQVSAGALAWGASVLAKYIPGGVWHVVGRGILLAERGVPAIKVFRSAVVEQLISTGSCLIIAVLAATAIRGGFSWLGVSLLASLTTLLYVLPMTFRDKSGITRPASYSIGLLLYFASMLPYAAAYVIVVSPESTLLFVQDLFEGTVAGLVVLFAPGGLGVRESWIAIQWNSNGGQLLATLLLARLVVLLSEVAITLASSLFASKIN